jgi:hypothetical protein
VDVDRTFPGRAGLSPAGAAHSSTTLSEASA